MSCALILCMLSEKKKLSLVDMDVGLFLSYEVTAKRMTTRLFKIIPLKSTPLKKVMDLREANDRDITKLNRVNWLSFMPSHRVLCPIYTVQTARKSPRIFMRLNRGSHIDMKEALELSYEV